MWVVRLQHIALCPPVVSSQWPETWAMGQPLIINKIGFLINLSRTRNRWFLSVNAVIKKHSFASRVVSAWVSLVSGQWSLLIRLSSAGGNIVSRNRFTLHQSQTCLRHLVHKHSDTFMMICLHHPGLMKPNTEFLWHKNLFQWWFYWRSCLEVVSFDDSHISRTHNKQIFVKLFD